ncbi:hypothetical protein DFH06DRAFT_577878 [Mycena polygramma]|nr:hypothetical protein DFH06DRAFT_577878 [Mycena polygramma]
MLSYRHTFETTSPSSYGIVFFVLFVSRSFAILPHFLRKAFSILFYGALYDLSPPLPARSPRCLQASVRFSFSPQNFSGCNIPKQPSDWSVPCG